MSSKITMIIRNFFTYIHIDNIFQFSNRSLVMVKFLHIFLILFVFNIAFAAEEPASSIRIEAKTFDDNAAFIFYHAKNQILNISSDGKLVTVRMNSPADFEMVNSTEFNRLAAYPSLSKDKKTISFATKDDLKSRVIINGERLVAIKFKYENDLAKAEEATKSSETAADTPDILVDNGNEQTIKYSTSKSGPVLTFDNMAKDTQIAAFFRGNYLWVIFDKQKQFNFNNTKIVSNLNQISNETASILRFKVEGYKNAKIIKNVEKWELLLNHAQPKPSKNSLLITDIENEGGVKIAGAFENNSIIEFHDPEVGDILKVVTTDNPELNLLQHRETVDFSILPSIIGVVVAITNEDIDFTKNTEFLKIFIKHNLPIVTNPSPQRITFAKVDMSSKGTLLPFMDKKLDIINYNISKNRLVTEASYAENDEEKFVKRYELAKFYFMQALYQESFAILSLIKRSTPVQYNASLEAQFLNAVTATMISEISAAKSIYEHLLKNVDHVEYSEIVLWNNYNEFLIGENANKIEFFSNLNKSVKFYSDDIYWPLALAELELTLLANDMKSVETIFKDLRTPSGNYANSLNYYKANYYRKKDQLNLAKQFFQDLVKKDDNPFNMVRSEIDLIKLQLAQKEISLNDAINRLNAIRFSWRGDTLEYDLLMLLARYYNDNVDNMNSLRTFKYIQTAFSNKISNFYITSEMVKIFDDVFMPGGTSDKMDDFNAVALFYEFKELNPIGAEGDEIILRIARRMVKLDLLETAASLLRHQVKYRLTGEKRITNADYLAIILLLDKKPNEAIQVLDDTDKENFKYNEHQYRIRLRTKALIDTKKYQEALSYLKDDYSTDADVLRKECLFQAEQWQDYINLVAPEVTKLLGIKVEGGSAQDILRLAIAYYLQNNQVELDDLVNQLDISNKALKEAINLLRSGNAKVDYKNLDHSLNIDQMQALLNKYKQHIFNDNENE